MSALERMVAAVKPGGVLVLEDYDFSASACHPADENFERVTDALVDSGRLTDADFDAVLAGLEDPRRTFVSPVLVAAHGRRPE